MLDKSQDILRLSFAAAALLIGGSVAYHYAIYIPEKDEEAKAEFNAKAAADERREQEQSELAQKTALEKRTGYRICVSNAVADYHARWQSSCKAISEEAANSRSNCLAQGFYNANTCASMYPVVSADNCRLPGALADSYDNDLRDEKQRCLAEVDNGLAPAM